MAPGGPAAGAGRKGGMRRPDSGGWTVCRRPPAGSLVGLVLAGPGSWPRNVRKRTLLMDLGLRTPALAVVGVLVTSRTPWSWTCGPCRASGGGRASGRSCASLLTAWCMVLHAATPAMNSWRWAKGRWCSYFVRHVVASVAAASARFSASRVVGRQAAPGQGPHPFAGCNGESGLLCRRPGGLEESPSCWMLIRASGCPFAALFLAMVMSLAL